MRIYAFLDKLLGCCCFVLDWGVNNEIQLSGMSRGIHDS